MTEIKKITIEEIQSLRTENEELKRTVDTLRAYIKKQAEHRMPNIFKEVLNRVNESIFLTNEDGNIIFANNKFCREYSIEPTMYTTKVYDIGLSFNDAESYKQYLQRLHDNDGRLVYQITHFNYSNNECTELVSVFEVHFEGKNFFWFFMQDITELVKSRDELREINNLLDVILDNIPVYLFVKDVDDDLRYLYWNKAFAENSQIPASKVIGHTDFEFFPSYDDARKFRNDDLELIKNNTLVSRRETFETVNGKTRIVQTNKLLVPREGRGPLLIGVSMDITNLQNIEQELVQERIKAEQSDRLKSAFLANMSHEIRTPLNAIVGFSSLLAKTNNPSLKKKYSDIIEQNSETMLQLINDILDISKIESGTLDYFRNPMDLRELFHHIYETFLPRIPDGVELILEIPDTPLIVNEDHNRLYQIVNNLLTNSIKFTSEGEIHFGYTIEEDRILVHVKDTGLGIPEDKIDSIFERFVKLNNFAQGTGLGLPICKLLVNILGGNIWVESKFGKGSNFYFTIPLNITEDDTEAKNKEALNTARSKPETVTEYAPQVENGNIDCNTEKTILIAEDVYSNYLLIESLIDDKYNLVWAQDGEEAVKKFNEINPDLILMDIKMPKLDGLQATRMIREQSKTVPIVAITAFAFDSDRMRALEAGASDYLSKPFSRQKFETIINKYL